MSWLFVIVGIALIIVAYFLYSPSNYIISVIIGAVGVLFLMLAYDRFTILFNRYQNR